MPFVRPGEQLPPLPPGARPVRWGIALDPPFAILNSTGTGFYGLLAVLIPAVFAELNADPVLNASGPLVPIVVQYPDYISAVRAAVSGVDNATSISYNPALLDSLVYTTSWWDMSMIQASKTAVAHPHTWVIVQPLTGGAWAVVGTLVLAFGLASYFADVCSPLGSLGYGAPLVPWLSNCPRIPRRKSQRRATALADAAAGSSHGHDHEPAQLVPTLFASVVHTMEPRFEPHVPKASSARFLGVGIKFVTLFILAFYLSALTALEVELAQDDPQLSLDELLREQLPFGILPLRASYFQQSASFAVRQMYPQMRLYDNVTGMLAAVRGGEIAAAMHADQSLRYFAAQEPGCGLTLDAKIGTLLPKIQIAVAWGMSAMGSPQLAASEAAVRRLRSTQQLAQLSSELIAAAGPCQVPTLNAAEASPHGVDVGSVGGAFVIAGGVLALAWISHALSALCVRTKRRAGASRHHGHHASTTVHNPLNGVVVSAAPAGPSVAAAAME